MRNFSPRRGREFSRGKTLDPFELCEPLIRKTTMSKYMQLTVTVRPYYEKNLEQTYPKLARNLKNLNANLVEQNPSLYEIVGQLDKLLHAFEGTKFREVFSPQREKLLNLHKSIEENIADWNLAQADRLLYKIEDVFEKIESELD